VTTNQIEEPIRGYSIRAFEAIAPDLLGIAPDRCAVKKIKIIIKMLKIAP
jgi:hypothetical protein